MTTTPATRPEAAGRPSSSVSVSVSVSESIASIRSSTLRCTAGPLTTPGVDH
ncbi:hypothetical protein SHJG_8108 [Streptomyces hygroscopicus subsp. jinggangensis 5008]|nr:hypothetical protein SHJG_8108 [Streptomyces hygroscopicus subsp. jinggangensis 5008]AGF67532.1 hypothetical protein SHJGH_7870 [Streptomyces hygroscopicus subsp. jinggangensis TL01]